MKNPAWRLIRHIWGNIRRPDAAHGITILTVYMAAGTEAATTVPFNVGEDHDRFIRTDEGWRFASRRWVALFARGDVLTLPQ